MITWFNLNDFYDINGVWKTVCLEKRFIFPKQNKFVIMWENIEELQHPRFKKTQHIDLTRTSFFEHNPFLTKYNTKNITYQALLNTAILIFLSWRSPEIWGMSLSKSDLILTTFCSSIKDRRDMSFLIVVSKQNMKPICKICLSNV